MSLIPTIKTPSWNVPPVRNLPTIPNVGCVSGNATTQIGEQFGNFPDIQALPHVKALNKVITEQIGTLLEGKLPDVPRAALYEIRQARLVTELANIVNTATQIAGQIQAEVNATISALNEKINEINEAKDLLLQIPENARSAIQDKTIGRYNEYIAEINAQIGKLQTTLGCLGGGNLGEIPNAVNIEYKPIEIFELALGQTTVLLETSSQTRIANLNGLILVEPNHYEVTENSLTLSSPANQGDILAIIHLS